MLKKQMRIAFYTKQIEKHCILVRFIMYTIYNMLAGRRPGGVVATIRATSRMTSGSILADAPINQSSHAKMCNRQMQVENHTKC